MSVMEVIENGLVPIYQDEQRRVVNARELHVFLEVGKDFSNWIKGRLDKYGFAEGYLTAQDSVDICGRLWYFMTHEAK